MNFKFEYVNKLKITITIVLAIGIFLFAHFFKDVFSSIENKTIDIRSYLTTDSGLFANKYEKADNDIVIISINDLTQYEAAHSSEINLTQWPWSRSVWAKVINFLEKQKPKVLIVDLNFSNYEDLSRNYTSPDMQLADALGFYNNTILSTALKIPYSKAENTDITELLTKFENPYNPTSYDLNIKNNNAKIDNNITYYAHTPIPNIFTNSTTMGVTNLVTNKNRDENIRYSQPLYKLIKDNKAYYIPSLGLAALLKYKGYEHLSEPIEIENNTLKIADHKIKINDNGQAYINWHAHNAVYQDIPINSILLSMVRDTEYFEYENQKYPLSYFKDKIVLISQTQQAIETHNTPIAKELPDAQIKATIIDNYINDADTKNSKRKNFLKKITPYKGHIITTFFCILIVAIMLIATNIGLAFFNSILAITAYVIVSLFLFAHPRFRIIVDMALPLYYIVSTFIIAFTLKVHHEYKKRKKIEKIFGNLVSQKVLKQLITKPHRLNLKSSVKKVTVMSCNIINNLQISEDISPEKYVQLLNNVFNAIENIIFKHNGTINRFIGNSVLVYWGYPIHSRKDAQNAINTAKEITKKIEEFNASIANLNFDKYDERNFKTTNPTEVSFNVKIAISSGDALIGQIGSSNVSDFTVMGDCVDVVEKMINVCEEFNKTIVVSESTLQQLDKEIPTIYSGQIRTKNNQNKTKIFEIKLP